MLTFVFHRTASMIRSFIIVFSILSLLCTSCQNNDKKQTSDKDRIKTFSVEIEKNDKEAHNPKYISPLFKIASFKKDESLKTLVLSNRTLSKEVEVSPIGMFSFTSGETTKEIILSVEVIDNQRVLDIQHFLEFSTEFYSIKQLIEIYFTNHQGIGKVKSFKWQNELAAYRKINLTK